MIDAESSNAFPPMALNFTTEVRNTSSDRGKREIKMPKKNSMSKPSKVQVVYHPSSGQNGLASFAETKKSSKPFGFKTAPGRFASFKPAPGISVSSKPPPRRSVSSKPRGSKPAPGIFGSFW